MGTYGKGCHFYLMNEDKVLLIHKKQGLGAGKINAPGGHIEEGRDPS